MNEIELKVFKTNRLHKTNSKKFKLSDDDTNIDGLVKDFINAGGEANGEAEKVMN